jgi:hypothetical protein
MGGRDRQPRRPDAEFAVTKRGFESRKRNFGIMPLRTFVHASGSWATRNHPLISRQAAARLRVIRQHTTQFVGRPRGRFSGSLFVVQAGYSYPSGMSMWAGILAALALALRDGGFILGAEQTLLGRWELLPVR